MENILGIENQKQQDKDNIQLELPVSKKPNIKMKFAVKPIKPEETYSWLLKKHYAKRIPMICYSFGLYDNDLQGVCTFGLGGNINNNKFGNFDMVELNRLVINEGLGKNVLSFFVANSLKMLPKPMVVISYADARQKHNGYIYQATNWLYTGLSSMKRTIVKDGKECHRKSLFDIYGTSSVEFLKSKGYEILEATAKHRYFYFLGNKKTKYEMMQILKSKYNIEPYPKGANQRYDASYMPNTQQTLF